MLVAGVSCNDDAVTSGTPPPALSDGKATETGGPERGRKATGGLDKLDTFLKSGGRPLEREIVVGHSALGAPIKALAMGGLGGTSEERVLVFGCIHGTECAGTVVVAALHERGFPPVNDVLSVPNLNPDGRAKHSRLNSRGVDLNRNFDADWRLEGIPGDPEYSGPRPFSEPETRLARRLIKRLHPDIIIWFHQQAEPLVRAWGPSVPDAREYAAHAQLRFRRMPWIPGTAPNWQNHAFPGMSSFVVELPLGPISRRAAWRPASAIANLGGRDSPLLPPRD